MSSSELNKLENFRIPLEEIKLGTNNFSQENYLGGGGFGKVFRGTLHESRAIRTAAFKRLNPESFQGKREFMNELSLLSGCRHENIISFIGYCDEDNEMIVVYEYAKNKSLDRYLGDTNEMRYISWVLRLQICIGSARGIDYLHWGLGANHRVIHRDIKSGNILLDDKWTAKISDFGLSKFSPKDQLVTQINTMVSGTPGYCDPYYSSSNILTKESDVYSFGVVMFEVMCGRLVHPKKIKRGDRSDDSQTSLLELVRRHKESLYNIIDPHIRDQMDSESLNKFTQIAYKCLKGNYTKRPTTTEIIEGLEEALSLQVAANSLSSGRIRSDVTYMSFENLLNIEPQELHFPFELKKQISCALGLRNRTNNYVSFKVKTTNPKNYIVLPNVGFVLPHSTCDIKVTMHAQTEAPANMQCKDMFLIQCAVASPGAYSLDDITRDLFIKESGNQVEEYKLKVIYVEPPRLPSPVKEGSEEGSLSRTSTSESTTLHTASSSDSMGTYVEPHDKSSQVSGYNFGTDRIQRKASNVSREDLLSFEPQDFRFPFELNKQVSCSMQLTNRSNNRVAFKVKNTNPKNYMVHPNIGFVLPHSTCDIKVTMHAQNEAPANMQCKDMFLIQSAVVGPRASLNDIARELFNKELGYQVDEYEFRVLYVAPLDWHH